MCAVWHTREDVIPSRTNDLVRSSSIPHQPHFVCCNATLFNHRNFLQGYLLGHALPSTSVPKESWGTGIDIAATRDSFCTQSLPNVDFLVGL